MTKLTVKTLKMTGVDDPQIKDLTCEEVFPGSGMYICSFFVEAMITVPSVNCYVTEATATAMKGGDPTPLDTKTMMEVAGSPGLYRSSRFDVIGLSPGDTLYAEAEACWQCTDCESQNSAPVLVPDPTAELAAETAKAPKKKVGKKTRK